MNKDKALIIAKLIEQLDAELARYARAAREAQAGATDEQSKPENKYDTRGLEASYLAHGQSRQAAETLLARQQIASLNVRDFAEDDGIEPGALVELVELGGVGERLWYLVAPGAGGREVVCEVEITVVTPGSPLGSQLMGRRAGDEVKGFRVARVV